MAVAGDWLRVRGIGRERFVGYLADYLASLGFTIERAETGEPAESRLTARLERMNPAVPNGAKSVAFRIYPTSGGAAVEWVEPSVLDSVEASRMDRFVREFTSHVERTVLTESHATAKVTRIPGAKLPWEASTPPPG